MPDVGCIPGHLSVSHVPVRTDHYLAGLTLSLKSTLTVYNPSSPSQRGTGLLVVLSSPSSQKVVHYMGTR